MLRNTLYILTSFLLIVFSSFGHAVITIITPEGNKVFITEDHELVTTKTGSVEELANSPVANTPVDEESPLAAYAKEAQALKSGCRPAETDGTINVIPKGAAVVPLEDSFFVIPRPERTEIINTWLAPDPGPAGNTSIHGIDRDRDCVRDDIENYIVKRFSHANHRRIRKYMFEYAVWLNQFLVYGINESTAKSTNIELAKAGFCLNKFLGYSRADFEINELFAVFHNTYPRSYRYIANLKRIGGWTTRDNIEASCQ